MDNSSTPGSLSLDTADIVGWTVVCLGGCPVHCRMFSGIPGFNPLDASSTLPPLSLDNQKYLQKFPCPLEVKIPPG